MCECARDGVRCRATGNAPNYPLFTQLYTHAKIAEVVTVIDTQIQLYRDTGTTGILREILALLHTGIDEHIMTGIDM